MAKPDEVDYYKPEDLLQVDHTPPPRFQHRLLAPLPAPADALQHEPVGPGRRHALGDAQRSRIAEIPVDNPLDLPNGRARDVILDAEYIVHQSAVLM